MDDPGSGGIGANGVIHPTWGEIANSLFGINIIKIIGIGHIVHCAWDIIPTAKDHTISLGLAYIAHGVLLPFFLGSDHREIQIAIFELTGNAEEPLRAGGIADVFAAGQREGDVTSFDAAHHLVFITGILDIHIVGIKELIVLIGVILQIYRDLFTDGSGEA